MKTLSRHQILAAIAQLEISQKELCDSVGISLSPVTNFLKGKKGLSADSLNAIYEFLTAKRMVFGDNHMVAQRAKADYEVLKGRAGFETFMDDVYESMADQGGMLSLYNTEPEYWIKFLGEEWYQMHNARMSSIEHPIKIRNAIKEGNDNYILNGCEYRWIPEEKWKNSTFYAYNSKLALLKFGEEASDTVIRILSEKDLVDAYMELFETAWEHNTIPARGAPKCI